MDILVNIPAVNPELLNQQLQMIGTDYQGVSTGPSDDPANPTAIRVHLTDSATDAEQQQAISLVHAHNPQQLTANQQAAQQAVQQLATVSGELGALITQVTALSKQLGAFTVAADPTAIATALNSLIPAIGQMVAGNAQMMTAIQLILQQQGR